MPRRLLWGLPLFAVALGIAGSRAVAASSVNRIAGHCSPTGDLCFGIVNRGGAVYLDLATVERYFARYRICAKPPAAAERCASFPVRRRGQIWGSTVKYGRRFPITGSGVYRVTWKLGTRPLGPALRFRLPLAQIRIRP